MEMEGGGQAKPDVASGLGWRVAEGGGQASLVGKDPALMPGCFRVDQVFGSGPNGGAGGGISAALPPLTQISSSRNLNVMLAADALCKRGIALLILRSGGG